LKYDGEVTKTIPASDLEPVWQKLIDDVAGRGDEILFTREGKAVARLIPMHVETAATITAEEAAERDRALEPLRGSVTILGDIVAPLADDERASTRRIPRRLRGSE
jgi:antitoxin (DNA-binding transcriptional repressor) of toxin-antitoxin stability system